MMTKSRKYKPYSKNELKVVGYKECIIPSLPGSDVFNTPISYRENVNAMFWEKQPCFAVTSNDHSGLNPDFYKKYLARAHRNDSGKIDAFGVKWTFEPTAGGSISVGGNPRFEDANDWKDVISMPSVADWDWAADAANNPIDTNFAVEMTFVNGFWFERLISLMDFMNAAMALVDEDQHDALHELFEATTGLACDLVDKICEYWPGVDGFMIHDDWGSQREPFFSDKIARELFLPHMKKLVSHVHDKGRTCSIHSCGSLGPRVPVFIEAGIDSWELQANANNLPKLYEDYGDQIILTVAIPDFDHKDEKAAVAAARNYVDTYCKPGKPTILSARNCMSNKVFAEEVYEYSRKHYLSL